MGERNEDSLLTSGNKVKTIDVALSYKIVNLFSEGLYSSANKTFEELVSNSFDAGAQKVLVSLPADLGADGAKIVVIDDGGSMDLKGLEQLWRIGESSKRDVPPKKNERHPIGKFGIGKLATYVLANRLSYICKREGKFLLVTMDYRSLDESSTGGLESQKPVQLEIRELSETEAKELTDEVANLRDLEQPDFDLFGDQAASAWTMAILTDLKEKAAEIEPGRLKWILSTALPLGSDFAVWVDGARLQSSKFKGRIKRWILGKEVKDLGKPAPEGATTRLDTSLEKTDQFYYGIFIPGVGRITGFVEGYKRTLTTGKSQERGRSHGFFVYVRGRLVNVDDEYFGIDANLLSHGVFNRFRCVVHADGLDSILRSSRENLAESNELRALRAFLQAGFNFVRKQLNSRDEKEKPSARISELLSGSPASISRKPIVELVRSAFSGDAKPRLVKVPAGLEKNEQEDLLSGFFGEFSARF